MDKAEFDKFADEYAAMHASNIRMSGEAPEYFAEYKIQDIAARIGDPGRPLRVLDFGGGIGGSIPHVRRHLPNARLTCLDVSERSLAVAKEHYAGEAEFLCFAGDSMPLANNSFDVAYAACVFHHIDGKEHQRLLEELLRVVQPNGWLFVFEHNPYNPLTRHAVDSCPFDENAVLIRGARMRDLIRRAGFGDVGLKYRIFFPRALRWLRRWETLLTWLPLGAQYYVCGRKPTRS